MVKEYPGWPPPKSCFSVQIGADPPAVFQEVEGLDSETQPIEYRHGNEPFAPIKMPGLHRVGNVTLRRGVIVRYGWFWKWYSKLQMNTLQAETIVIALHDETGKPTMTWTLTNARPLNLITNDTSPAGDEVAIESLKLTYESLVMAAT